MPAPSPSHNTAATTQTDRTHALSHLYQALLEDLDAGKSASTLSMRLSEAEALDVSQEQKSAVVNAIRTSISLAQRNEQYQLNERSLRAVSESAESLTELKDPNAVLNSIAERGRKLLGSDIAWMAGKIGDQGQILAIDGAYTELIKKLSGPVDAGIAGHVRKTRSPFTTQDYLAETQFAHNSVIDQAMRDEGIQSVVSAPILSDSEVIGVLIVADRYRRLYQPWEISVLTTLAAHASVAIRNARTFEQKQQALRSAEQANRELEDKVAVLEYATDAHERLTRQLAKGSTQQDMLRLIADILSGEVAFFDPAGSVISAYPTDALSFFETLAIDSHFRADAGAAIDRSRFSGRYVRADYQGNTLCVMAVSSGTDHLGSLLIRTEAELPDHKTRIFERASTAIAVLNLLEEKKTASNLQDIRTTVADLLTPKDPTTQATRTRALQIGIDTQAPMVLAVIALEPSKRHHFLKKIGNRLKLLTGVVTELDNHLTVLINAEDALTARQFLREHVTSEANWAGLIALSNVIEDATRLPREFRLATRALHIAGQLGRQNALFFYHEYAIYAPLFGNSSSVDIDAYITATIGDLIESDRDRKTELVRTLLTFLNQQQNARATARKLRIHVNTVHNRLEAISNLIGPWQLHNRALEIHLALQLFSLRQGAG